MIHPLAASVIITGYCIGVPLVITGSVTPGYLIVTIANSVAFGLLLAIAVTDARHLRRTRSRRAQPRR